MFSCELMCLFRDMQHCKFFSCPLHFMNILAVWHVGITLSYECTQTHIKGTKSKCSVNEECHSAKAKQNPAPPGPWSVNAHRVFTSLMCSGLTLGEKATLNDCDYLHSAQAPLLTVHWQPWRMCLRPPELTLTSRKRSDNMSVTMNVRTCCTFIPCFIKIGNQ